MKSRGGAVKVFVNAKSSGRHCGCALHRYSEGSQLIRSKSLPQFFLSLPPPFPPFPLLQLVLPVRYVVVLQSITKPCQRKSRYCSGTRGNPAIDCRFY